MTEQSESGLVKPHVLIVGKSTQIGGHQGLGEVLRDEGISYELVPSTGAKPALKRLQGGEPPITGVLTEGLGGEYPLVIEAARRIGANAVLLTRSAVVLQQAREQKIRAYSHNKIVGRLREMEAVHSLISDLVPSTAASSQPLREPGESLDDYDTRLRFGRK